MRKLILSKSLKSWFIDRFLSKNRSTSDLSWKNKRPYFFKYIFFSMASFYYKHKFIKKFCKTFIENSSNYRSRIYRNCIGYLGIWSKYSVLSDLPFLGSHLSVEAQLPDKVRYRRRIKGKLRKRVKFFVKKEGQRFDKICSYYLRIPFHVVIKRRLKSVEKLDSFISFVNNRFEMLRIEEEKKAKEEEKRIQKEEENFHDENRENEEKQQRQTEIVHFKPNVVLSKNITNSFSVKRNLLRYKLQFLLSSIVKMDPIFFSLFFTKFISKAMFAGKKSKFFFIISSVFLLIKFFTALRPFYVFFSSLESSRVVVGHIPKKISGKVQIVPTYLYFGKQIQTAIGLFVKTFRKRQDFVSSVLVENVGFKTKRLSRLASMFVKNQKIYFSKFSKYTQRKNFVFDIIKKNYYLYISNRSNLQYRWR